LSTLQNPSLSKALAIFTNRYQDDKRQLEVTEAALNHLQTTVKANLGQKKRITDILELSASTYKSLAVPLEQHHNIVNRASKNNVEFVLRRIYTHFGEYCKNILRDMYEHNPMLIVGKAPNSLKYHDIVKLGSYDAIANFMVDQVFKRLEGERSTLKTLHRLLDGTDVELETDMLDEAMGFFEIRHLLVHQSGIIDQSFFERYPEFLRVPTKIGGKLPLTAGFAKRGMKSVKTLVSSIDSQLKENGAIT